MHNIQVKDISTKEKKLSLFRKKLSLFAPIIEQNDVAIATCTKNRGWYRINMQNIQAMYVKIDPKAYMKTGEVIIVGEPQTIEGIVGNVGKAPKGGFSITRDENLSESYKSIKGRMGIVFAYLVEKRDSDNQVLYNLGEMSKRTGLTRRSVMEAIKHFEEEGMIVRVGNRLMVHPCIVHKGNRQREAQLLNLFEQMKKNISEEA